MDLERELVEWMEEHEREFLDLLAEEAERFRAHHPGASFEQEQLNGMIMANRRFIARALGQVLPRHLGRRE